MLGRTLGLPRADTLWSEDTRLLHNQLNLLYCLNQGSYVQNGG